MAAPPAQPPRTPTETRWPRADVVIGNPPFLGDKKMRAELGDAYTDALRKTYAGRVPGGADLVCYWFEKARAAIEQNALSAAGLVATNSIRGGRNRVVLDAIVQDSRIFDAWSDEPWVNEGAAVRVSLVAFGRVTQAAKLDGNDAATIHADLTAGTATGASLDITSAALLRANKAACFIGGMKKGPFDVPGATARGWLRLPNPNGKSNAEVVKPWFNGLDVTRRPLDQWIVDFGLDMPVTEAALYEAPFSHVLRAVRPKREAVRNQLEKSRWWLHARPAPDLRRAVATLPRSAATARVAKHRLFIWLQPGVIADGQLVITARADDTTFGILHSRFHELWSLRMGTSLEDRPRYTPTTCFETFPFPTGLTPFDTAHQRTEQIASGALIPAGLGPCETGNSERNNAAASANQS
ncbi:MAG: class I SAM-dependent DNA methyltransferase, partial [Proteobacteria bacterium]|nr:class I SAM-dependent DNA methyltransferase [Pseudomonadota bacterium]